MMEKLIPGFAGYTIDELGIVRKIIPYGIIEPQIGRRSNEFRVTIKNDMWKVVRPKVSRLVLMAFHPVIDFDYDWISASYKDGDFSNFTLEI